MAHFAMIVLDAAGHLLSVGPVGQELVRRGHRVTVVSFENAGPLAKSLDLPLCVLESKSIPIQPSSLARWAFRQVGVEVNAALRDHVRWLAEVVMKLAPTPLRELGVDGVLTDEYLMAGGTVAEHIGVPFVNLSPSMFWNREPGVPPSHTGWPYLPGRLGELRNRLGNAGYDWFTQPALSAINRQRRQWALPRLHRIDDAYSPLAQITQLCPEFDYPRRHLPDTFHYIGSFSPGRQLSSDQDFPWDRLDGRPLIFASLGTVPDEANLPVFPRIVAACAGLDAQLVLALGKWCDEEGRESVRERLGEIPENVLVVDFAPQMDLLKRARLLITHAGANTTLESLSVGVPIVALPRSADQPAIAARVAYSGAGLVGSFHNSTPEQIRALVHRVLTEDSFRERARELQRALDAAGGSSRAADITEEALTTRRPVRRQSVNGHVRRSADGLPLVAPTSQFVDGYLIDAPVLDR